LGALEKKKKKKVGIVEAKTFSTFVCLVVVGHIVMYGSYVV
jgi:hypothetical protein